MWAQSSFNPVIMPKGSLAPQEKKCQRTRIHLQISNPFLVSMKMSKSFTNIFFPCRIPGRSVLAHAHLSPRIISSSVLLSRVLCQLESQPGFSYVSIRVKG